MLRMVSVSTSSSFGLCEPTQLSSLLYSLFFLFVPVPRLSLPLVCLCKHVSKSQALKRYDCDVRTMHIYTISAKQGFYCKTKHAFKSNVIFARKCL